MVYLLKCEKDAVIWEFYFYQTGNAWQLTLANFDPDYHLIENERPCVLAR
jgi:hypothetical protein